MTKQELKAMVQNYRADNNISIHQFSKHSGVGYCTLVAIENEKADKLRDITIVKITRAVQREYVGE
jgi:DNA-binding XRE family transcriptional regulator